METVISTIESRVNSEFPRDVNRGRDHLRADCAFLYPGSVSFGHVDSLESAIRFVGLKGVTSALLVRHELVALKAEEMRQKEVSSFQLQLEQPTEEIPHDWFHPASSLQIQIANTYTELCTYQNLDRDCGGALVACDSVLMVWWSSLTLLQRHALGAIRCFIAINIMPHIEIGRGEHVQATGNSGLPIEGRINSSIEPQRQQSNTPGGNQTQDLTLSRLHIQAIIRGSSAAMSIILVLCLFGVPVVLYAVKQEVLSHLAWLTLVPIITLAVIPLVLHAAWRLRGFLMAWHDDRSSSLYYSTIASIELPTEESDQPKPSFTFIVDLSTCATFLAIRQLLEGLEAAIDRYKKIGGSANVLVCDSRISQLPRTILHRLQWLYTDHSISWLAGSYCLWEYNTFRSTQAQTSGVLRNMSQVLDAVTEFTEAISRLLESHNVAMAKLDGTIELEDVSNFVRSSCEPKRQDFITESSFSSPRPLSDWVVVLDRKVKIHPDILLHAAAEIYSSPSVELFYHASQPYVGKGTFAERILAYEDILYGGYQDCISAATGWPINPWSGRGMAIMPTRLMNTQFSPHEDDRQQWPTPTTSYHMHREIAWQCKLSGTMSKTIREASHGPLSVQGQFNSVYEYINYKRVLCEAAVQAVFLGGIPLLGISRRIFSKFFLRVCSSDLSMLEKSDLLFSIARYAVGSGVLGLFFFGRFVLSGMTITTILGAFVLWYIWVRAALTGCSGESL